MRPKIASDNNQNYFKAVSVDMLILTGKSGNVYHSRNEINKLYSAV